MMPTQVFTLTLRTEFSCILFPLVICQMFPQLAWSTHVANSVE